MRAVYGTPPVDLVSVPTGAVQLSPLIPGSAAIEAMEDGILDGMIVHAPRGKLERRYILAQALRALRTDATLTVLAHKKQGGARLRDEFASFGVAADVTSKQHCRICSVRRPDRPLELAEAIAGGGPQRGSEHVLWTQPGIFSWDRIDPGSAMLIMNLPRLTGRGADFGCGFGLLAYTVLRQSAVTHVTLIDIDRRAVEAARRNMDGSHAMIERDGYYVPAASRSGDEPRAQVLWADLRNSATLVTSLDFVVMNPPFHDGGLEDQGLGRLFLQRAAEALRPGGLCLVTANRHLPYEAAMRPLFSVVEQIEQDNVFKVYGLRK